MYFSRSPEKVASVVAVRLDYLKTFSRLWQLLCILLNVGQLSGHAILFKFDRVRCKNKQEFNFSIRLK